MARTRSSGTSDAETAFVVDEERLQASPDGTYFAGLPGLWRPDEAVHPDALGLTLAEMRDVVRELDLPLKEVKTSDALHGFRDSHEKLASAPTPVGGAIETAVDPADEIDGPTIGEEVTVENALLAAGAMEEIGGEES